MAEKHRMPTTAASTKFLNKLNATTSLSWKEFFHDWKVLIIKSVVAIVQNAINDCCHISQAAQLAILRRVLQDWKIMECVTSDCKSVGKTAAQTVSLLYPCMNICGNELLWKLLNASVDIVIYSCCEELDDESDFCGDEISEKLEVHLTAFFTMERMGDPTFYHLLRCRKREAITIRANAFREIVSRKIFDIQHALQLKIDAALDIAGRSLRSSSKWQLLFQEAFDQLLKVKELALSSADYPFEELALSSAGYPLEELVAQIVLKITNEIKDVVNVPRVEADKLKPFKNAVMDVAMLACCRGLRLADICRRHMSEPLVQRLKLAFGKESFDDPNMFSQIGNCHRQNFVDFIKWDRKRGRPRCRLSKGLRQGLFEALQRWLEEIDGIER